MRVLLYHCLPFALAHGGQQIQIERTREALRKAGVEAEFLDWHDVSQTGSVLHFFGRLPVQILEHARQKGMRVVVTDLLGAQGVRPRWRLTIERCLRRIAEAACRRSPGRLSWATYRQADACIALTSWEARLLRDQFAVPPGRIHVVPNGVDEAFLNGSPEARGQWLLYVATIAPVKRVLEVAQAAVHARTPLMFVGRAYSDSDAYARLFTSFVRSHPELLRYEGEVADRASLARVYRQARGFVLLSRWETLSLAALEAAACGCPLLLSDLPWAKSAFGTGAALCPAEASVVVMAAHLRAFYDHAPEQPAPAKPAGWEEVGRMLKTVYEK